MLLLRGNVIAAALGIAFPIDRSQNRKLPCSRTMIAQWLQFLINLLIVYCIFLSIFHSICYYNIIIVNKFDFI